MHHWAGTPRLELEVSPGSADEHAIPILLHFHGNSVIALLGRHVAREAGGPVDERIAACSEGLGHAETGKVVYRWDGNGQGCGRLDDAAARSNTAVGCYEGEDQLVTVRVRGTVDECTGVTNTQHRSG